MGLISTQKDTAFLEILQTGRLLTLTFVVGDGKKLASIGLDNDHSMAIWDWRKGHKLATSKTYQDKVFSVCFDSENSEKLVTCGVKHIKFWNHVGE